MFPYNHHIITSEMLLNWITYEIRWKRKLTFVLPWNIMLPFQKCRDICGRMQYGDRCYHCLCYLGVSSIGIFFVPLVQKNHFDVVFNANIWACYIQYWCFLKLFNSHTYLSYFPPLVLLAVSSLIVVIIPIVNVNVLVKELSPEDFCFTLWRNDRCHTL